VEYASVRSSTWELFFFVFFNAMQIRLMKREERAVQAANHDDRDVIHGQWLHRRMEWKKGVEYPGQIPIARRNQTVETCEGGSFDLSSTVTATPSPLTGAQLCHESVQSSARPGWVRLVSGASSLGRSPFFSFFF